MSYFDVTMQHTEKTFEALSRMQYDLFCRQNRIVRTLLSLVFIVLGITRFSDWWGILLVAYGCYLTTSTYSSANHTAHKLTARIKESGMPFPSSRYLFRAREMEIRSLPEGAAEGQLAYQDMLRIAEDYEYFYIFRDRFGGYMIPKTELKDAADDFRQFLEEKTGQKTASRTAPVMKLLRWLRRRR